jgi:hypothetical protein
MCLSRALTRTWPWPLPCAGCRVARIFFLRHRGHTRAIVKCPLYAYKTPTNSRYVFLSVLEDTTKMTAHSRARATGLPDLAGDHLPAVQCPVTRTFNANSPKTEPITLAPTVRVRVACGIARHLPVSGTLCTCTSSLLMTHIRVKLQCSLPSSCVHAPTCQIPNI